MTIALYILLGIAAVWLASPIISGLYLLILLRKDVRFVAWVTWYAAQFELISKHSYYASLWERWAGCGLFGYMITTDKATATTLLHESRHCWQALIGGGWHSLAYAAHYLFIAMFQKGKDPYRDNLFERDARRFAGQPVDGIRRW